MEENENKNKIEPFIAENCKDKTDRVIYLGEIDNYIAAIIASSIFTWNQQDCLIPFEERKPIRIFINSTGGDLDAMFLIIDAIANSFTPVYGINLHEASSAAAVIFSSCHRRAAMENSFFLFHLGEGGTYGTFRQIISKNQHYKYCINQMKRIIIRNLGIESLSETFNTLMETEWFLYTDDIDESSNSSAKKFHLLTDAVQDLIY